MSIQKEENVAEPKKLKHTLFGGAIGYDSPSDYEQFIQTLDKNRSLQMLITAVHYGQTRGIYSIQEAELLAACIKSFLIKPSAETTPADTNPES